MLISHNLPLPAQQGIQSRKLPGNARAMNIGLSTLDFEGASMHLDLVIAKTQVQSLSIPLYMTGLTPMKHINR